MRHLLHRLSCFAANGLRFAADWGIGQSACRTWNRGPGEATAMLCHELGITPRTMVDVGARNSEFTYWVQRSFQEMHIISFEPDIQRCHPMGNVFCRALSDVAGSGELDTDGGRTCPNLVESVEGAIPVVRFDQLNLRFDLPAILKVDAENHTFKAMVGFGDRLSDFSLVVTEVMNHHVHPSNAGYSGRALLRIAYLMAQRGFSNSRVLDTGAKIVNRIENLDVAFWK